MDKNKFLSNILGDFSWDAPPWFIKCRHKCASRPGLFFGTILAIIVLLLSTFFTYRWYQHLPKPILPTAQITSPKITPLADDLVPESLTLDFGLIEKENDSQPAQLFGLPYNDIKFVPQSVAPLNMVYKDLKQGVSLTPPLAGKWYWESDSRLIFIPTQDWAAGQTYSIHFDKSVFASSIKMEGLNYSFSTVPFVAVISDYKLYQDPLEPTIRRAVATLTFNYPVDADSLEKNVTLQLEALKNWNAETYKFTITYDKNKRTAYLQSEPIKLTDTPRYLNLRIKKGIKPLSGNPTEEELSKNILIPDIASYFNVARVGATIVRNDQDRPEQVITLETSLGVKENELNKNLHVYVLPQDYPATSLEAAKTNFQWSNPGEVTNDILQISTPLNLQPIPTDQDFASLHSYKFNTKPPRFLYLKLDKGLKGFGNFVLTRDYVTIIRVPDFPKEISFLHKGSLLSLAGEQKLSVAIRGLPAVKFQFARVLPDDVNQLITQTNGTFDQPRFLNDSFNQQNISEIFSEIQQLDQSDPSKAQYTALNIGKYLSSNANTGGPRGLFLLHAVGWDVDKKIALDTKSDRLVLLTDLGLLVKDNQDGSHDVFVQSISLGMPQANVIVSILGKNGLPILTRTTDTQGRVNFPTMQDFTEDREPTVYLAKLNNDVSFIPFNKSDRQLNYTRYDIGGAVVNADQDAKALSAYLFSDRGIYRPGDEAHIGMIVKRMYVGPQEAGLPLEVVITDPRGTTIRDEKFNLGAIGLSTLDFKTNSSSPTGQYNINLYISQDNHPGSLLGSTSIRVAEFLPDRMRISAHLSTEQTKGWISPDNLSANVALSNLYGAPAANRKVSAKILLSPKQIQFDEYPNYIFMDPLFDPNKPPKVFSEDLSDVKTNENGDAKFDLNLGRFDKATYQLTFYTEGFEADSGRSVTTQSSALVSPLPYLVGYKSDSDLNFIKQNSQQSIHFIAINPQLKQQTLNDLKLQLIALQPVTTLVKNPNGTYQYQSIVQTRVVSTTPFVTSDKGTNYTLPTQEIGNFAVSILDHNNIELSRFKFNVVGASVVPIQKNAELTVKLNKEEYVAGEDIELQITAPYTGSGLITIERDKVYAAQWFKTDITNSIQKIHIPADFQGNGYINVAFVRDWNSPEIFISPLSYSIVPFSINNNAHSIKIDLAMPELVRPGEILTINYHSDKPGKIIVYAVDKGILQVSKYVKPDPLAFFFQKYALQVITQQTLDQILPKFILERELSAVGGDGGEEELRSYLNPFKRKTDLPVVFWSGVLDTDTTPRQVEYQIPDYFNGELQVMAVAVSTDSVGSAERAVKVKGDFVINPNIPTFVAPEDEFEITASIANNVKDSGKNAPIEVKLNVSPDLKIVGNSNQTVMINEGQEQTVRFKVQASGKLGSSDITYLTRYKDKESKITTSISIRPPNPYSIFVSSGGAIVKKSITVNQNLYPEHRMVEAAISSSPLILVYGLQRYLDNFPYGCTEQLVSKAFPLLVMNNQPWFAENVESISEKIQATIQMLGQRQMSNGAFSYWPSMNDNVNNSFASVYAMHFLTEARRHGLPVPTEMFQSGTSYLKELASGDVNDLEQARIQAYAIYLLTRNEMVTTNYLTHLLLFLEKDTKHEWHRDLTSAYIASTYQLLKGYAEADKIINYYKPHINSSNSNYDFYNNNIANAQYIYLLAIHFPDRLKKDGNQLIMSLVDALNQQEINTIYSSYASIALSAYGQIFQNENSSQLSIDEKLMDGSVKGIEGNGSYKKVLIDNLTTQVIFNNSSNSPYFYQLTQSGFDKTKPTSQVNQGLEIYREYRDAAGNVVTQAKLGEDITVHIRLRALKESYLSNIVVVDLLPGGFEVVRDSVKTENMDYADTREDRVIFFGSATSDVKEIVYKIKATNLGHYILPPVYASSMYNLKLKSMGLGGSIIIE